MRRPGFLVTQIEDACAANEERRHDVSIEQMRGHYLPHPHDGCNDRRDRSRVAACVNHQGAGRRGLLPGAVRAGIVVTALRA